MSRYFYDEEASAALHMDVVHELKELEPVAETRWVEAMRRLNAIRDPVARADSTVPLRGSRAAQIAVMRSALATRFFFAFLLDCVMSQMLVHPDVTAHWRRTPSPLCRQGTTAAPHFAACP